MSISEETRMNLLKAIRDKAYRTGDFTLASGRKSDYYIDLKELTLDAAGCLLAGRAIYDRIRDMDISAVGGMELGSVPISTSVCLVSALEGAPLNNFIVRKEAKSHGTGKRLEGKVNPGDKVVVVEDVVSTGGSSVKAIEAVEQAGAFVEALVAIVDRQMGGAETFEKRGVRYIPLYTVTDIRELTSRAR